MKVKVKFLNLTNMGCHVISCVFNSGTPFFGSDKPCVPKVANERYYNIVLIFGVHRASNSTGNCRRQKKLKKKTKKMIFL